MYGQSFLPLISKGLNKPLIGRMVAVDIFFGEKLTNSSLASSPIVKFWVVVDC
jgi:hypothetical protein